MSDEKDLEIQRLKDENQQLRRIWCGIYAGVGAYMDNGEAQDNRMQPFIDFMKMSISEIQECQIDRMRRIIAEDKVREILTDIPPSIPDGLPVKDRNHP